MADQNSTNEPSIPMGTEAGDLPVAQSQSSDKSSDGGWTGQADAFTKQAKDAAWSAANSAKSTTGEALAGLSKLIAETAETVDSKLGPQYGDYARKAAEAVAGAAKSIDEKELDVLAEDARNFVRKSPAVTIGAAAVVGFVLMRLMRGGSSNDA